MELNNAASACVLDASSMGAKLRSASVSSENQAPDAATLADQDGQTAIVTSSQPQQLDSSATTTAASPPPPPRHVCLEWVEAAKSGDVLELRRLLRAWPQLLNTQVGGLQATASHWAAANGHIHALTHLCIEWGADITTARTETGGLPIHSAAAAGRAECVQLLLAAADPESQRQQLAAVNEDGLTPAALALRHGHTLVQGMLLQAAQQQQATATQQQEAAASLSDSGDQQCAAAEKVAAVAPAQSQPVNTTTKATGMRRGFFNKGATSRPPQQLPVQQQQQQGYDTGVGTATAGQGQTAVPDGCWDSTVDNPLFGAACTTTDSPAKQQQQQPAAPAPQQAGSSSSSSVETAAPGPCQQQQAEPQATATAIDRSVGRSWLDAARAGDLSCLQAQLLAAPQLLNYRGAGINHAFVGNSALHWAAAKGHVGCVRWLLQQGASAAVVNEAGATALHTAVEHRQPACAEVLVLLGGADVRAVDGYGQTVLAAASAAGGGGSALAQQLMRWHEARVPKQQQQQQQQPPEQEEAPVTAAEMSAAFGFDVDALISKTRELQEMHGL